MADRPPVTRTLPPIPTSGAVGNVPPPNAPREVNADLTALDGGVVVDGQLITPQAMARANERELAPLTYPKVGGEGLITGGGVVAAAAVQAPREVVAAGPAPEQVHTAAAAEPPAPAAAPVRAPRRPFGWATKEIREENRAKADAKAEQRAARAIERETTAAAPVADASTAPAAPVRPVVDATTAHVPQAPKPVLAAGGPGAQVAEVIAARKVGAAAQNRPDPDAPYQPAASNSDSPARGIPRAIADKGKQITGGFGVAADAQYFPLDGAELLNVIWLLMDELAQRLPNDLRFSIAATYPRVSVRAQIVVEGWAEDQGFVIEKIMPPHAKTPVDIAQQRADEVVFIVKAERREFTEDGEIASPPNAMRAETGQTIPRKQWVGTGVTRSLADVNLAAGEP